MRPSLKGSPSTLCSGGLAPDQVSKPALMRSDTQAVRFRFAIAELPVQARYFPEASSVNIRVNTIYSLKTLGVMLAFFTAKMRIAHFEYLEKSLAQVVRRHHHRGIFST